MGRLGISIALCTCNGSRFLQEQLRTISCQTQLPDEVVVCDDVSKDDTLHILNEYAAQAGFAVRIFANPERLGPARNFEKAIAACWGDIIVLADQDDVWRPHKVSSLVGALERNPESVYAFSDGAMVDQDGRPSGQTLWESVKIRNRIAGFSGAGQVEILLKENFIPGAALAFRSSFRTALLPLPAGWMHDYWIVLLGSVLGDGVSVDDLLFDYRRHPNQVCGLEKETFAELCRDSFGIRSEESWRKVDILQELLDRARALAPSEAKVQERVELVKEKKAHLLRRAHVRSASGLSRIAQVMAEAATGRYRRFSRSWYSVIRDL
jgi:glycosyltransferase involved in cell wall biosynthesis